MEAMAEHDEQERAHLAASLRGFPSAASFLESAESLSDTVEVWDTEHRVLERARHEAQSAERAVEKALEASPFASEDAVLRAILEDRDAAELTAWHEKWTRDVARVEAELATQDMQRAARLSEETVRSSRTTRWNGLRPGAETWRSCVTGSPSNSGACTRCAAISTPLRLTCRRRRPRTGWHGRERNVWADWRTSPPPPPPRTRCA